MQPALLPSGDVVNVVGCADAPAAALSSARSMVTVTFAFPGPHGPHGPGANWWSARDTADKDAIKTAVARRVEAVARTPAICTKLQPLLARRIIKVVVFVSLTKHETRQAKAYLKTNPVIVALGPGGLLESTSTTIKKANQKSKAKAARGEHRVTDVNFAEQLQSGSEGESGGDDAATPATSESKLFKILGELHSCAPARVARLGSRIDAPASANARSFDLRHFANDKPSHRHVLRAHVLRRSLQPPHAPCRHSRGGHGRVHVGCGGMGGLAAEQGRLPSQIHRPDRRGRRHHRHRHQHRARDLGPEQQLAPVDAVGKRRVPRGPDPIRRINYGVSSLIRPYRRRRNPTPEFEGGL